MIKHRPIRLMFHGEFMLTTGFGGVSVNILDRLYNAKTEWGTPKYEIIVMALGLQADPFNNYNVKPYKIIPMYGNRNAAPFGHDYAADMINRFKPDVVLSFGDTWMVDFWNEPSIINPELRKKIKLIGYVAIDGYPVPKFWVEKYKRFDKLVTFTKFGKDAIDERAKQMQLDIDTAYIYHGVDPQVFKPLPKSDVAQFKASRGIDPNKKIIGMFSRNQPRKHHPEFVEFAAQFLETVNNNPDYLFYFHCMERDAGWDLNALIEDIDQLRLRDRFLQFGKVEPGQQIPDKKASLLGRFIFPGINNPGNGYPLDLLNMMYNICDVHVLLTSGEGFGMTVIESISAGIPTFTNDYAASAELITNSKAGEVIKSRDYTYRGSDHNFYRPHTDYSDLVNKVLETLNNDELKTKYSKRGRSYAIGNSWDIIVEEWIPIIDSVFEHSNKIKPIEV